MNVVNIGHKRIERRLDWVVRRDETEADRLIIRRTETLPQRPLRKPAVASPSQVSPTAPRDGYHRALPASAVEKALISR
jgi:hypothetical protein